MGHLDIVRFLLQHGCDPNATTMRGETSLHLAARGNQTDVMKLLIHGGAEVDARAKVSIVCGRSFNISQIVQSVTHFLYDRALCCW